MKSIIDGIRYFVVHAGKSHLDEVMAVALFMAMKVEDGYARGAVICRRDPTPEELDAPDVAVIDVGGVHDPAHLNFDHHQFQRGTKESAMGLVASWMGIREKIAKLFPWFETRVELDSTGPFATAKAAGTDWNTVAKFLGPCEQIMLRDFEEEGDNDRWVIVAPLAETIAAKLAAYDEVEEMLVTWDVKGVKVYDFLAADPEKTREVSDALVGDKGVAVFHDDRGSGLTLLRLNDDPRIDFSRLSGHPEVLFAHANGFILKTRDKLGPEVVNEIIRLATK